ncbi:putative membrane protein [Bacteroides fragilis str. 3988 T1]|nr:putative membrane protein [Bacteroides fragilis str. 3988 T1]
MFIKNFIFLGLCVYFFCVFSLGFRGLCKMLVAYEGYIYFCMYPAFCILSKF